MGVFSDLLGNSQSIDINEPITALDRSTIQYIEGLKAKFDPDYPDGYDAEDEVQSMAANDASGGTFTLTVTLFSGESFTTANIAYDAAAATIEGAIDSAATSATVEGWTNGDISVGGGAADSAPVTFTFDGDSVSGLNHPLITVDGGSLTGGSEGAVSVTNEGQSKRTAWAALFFAGAISGTPPTQGTSATVTAANTRATHPLMPSQDVIRTLAKEAAVADQNADVEAAILAALNIQAT